MTDSIDTSEREAEEPRGPFNLPIREMREEPVPHQPADPLRAALQLALEATPEQLPFALRALQPLVDDTINQPSGELPAWNTCASRGPWVRNGLKAAGKEMRAKELRCRSAYRQPFMGEPATYIADAYAEAACVFEARLAALTSSTKETT